MQFAKGGPDIPVRLLQVLGDRRVVRFCGAGISYPARLPGFASLVDKPYSGLEANLGPLEAAAIKAKLCDTAVGLLGANYGGGRGALPEKLAEIRDSDTPAPDATATKDALPTLGECWERRTRLITTNFDRVLEHVIASSRFG